MKDRLTLIGAALILAPLCWAFWHYLGQEAFNVLTLVFVLVIVADNLRLRRRVKVLQAPLASPLSDKGEDESKMP